jgi:8-oxo-dGTP diphosphatase
MPEKAQRPDDSFAPTSQRPIPAVGIVCFNPAGEVLLIRRGTPPRLGEWSIPGGKIEWGESARAAALRELKEETGLDGELVGLIDVVDGIFTSRATGDVTRHYVLIDFAATCGHATPSAGDDAAEARFFEVDSLTDLSLWDATLAVIAAGRDLLASKRQARALFAQSDENKSL